MYCKNCGSQIDDNAFVCVHCGVRTDADIENKSDKRKFCPYCGNELDGNAYICVRCGKIVADEPKRRGTSTTKFAVISFIFTLLTVTFVGAFLAIYGIVASQKTNDVRGFKLNVAALIYSVILSLLTVITALF